MFACLHKERACGPERVRPCVGGWRGALGCAGAPRALGCSPVAGWNFRMCVSARAGTLLPCCGLLVARACRCCLFGRSRGFGRCRRSAGVERVDLFSTTSYVAQSDTQGGPKRTLQIEKKVGSPRLASSDVGTPLRACKRPTGRPRLFDAAAHGAEPAMALRARGSRRIGAALPPRRPRIHRQARVEVGLAGAAARRSWCC